LSSLKKKIKIKYMFYLPRPPPLEREPPPLDDDLLDDDDDELDLLGEL
jgi:hypothetical protein